MTGSEQAKKLTCEKHPVQLTGGVLSKSVISNVPIAAF
jgi:hypothetical protein